MFETDSRFPCASEVYVAQDGADERSDTAKWQTETEGEVESGAEEFERFDEHSGQIFLTKPKRAQKSKNAPGAAVSARKGAARVFQHVPNVPRAKGEKAQRYASDVAARAIYGITAPSIHPKRKGGEQRHGQCYW